MENRIVLQNLVKKFNDEPEQELPLDQIIRFEFNDIELQISIEENGLKIYKSGGNTSNLDTINIRPNTSNVIYIS